MLRLPIRGGNWNNGANAGAFSVNLNNPRSNANGNIGFRPALPSKSDTGNLPGFRSVPRCKGSYFRAAKAKNKGLGKTSPFGHRMLRVVKRRNPQCPKMNGWRG